MLLAAVLAGCSSEPSPPTFVVSPSQQWSGGELTIRSDAFRGRNFPPGITAGGIFMGVFLVNDTTVVAYLPPGLPTGSVPLVLHDGSSTFELGSVDVFGFRARTQASPGFLWEPLIHTAANGAPVAVAGLFTQPAQGSIGIVDLRTAQTAVETGVQPPQWANAHGVGASFQSGHLILRDSTGTLGDWQVRPTLVYADTVPTVAFSRQVARLADQVWVFTSNHTTTVRRSGAPDILVQQEDPWGFHLSAAADRALMNSGLTVAGGSPVFRMSTGDTVFRLPIGVRGAAFSQDGQTLFVVGENGINPDEILAVSAATGAVIGNANLSTNLLKASGLALSADGSHIFVGAMKDSIPQVLVFDAGSLNQIGHLAATTATACSSCGANLLFQAALAVDDATGTVFLVSQGEPALIWEFDALP